MDKTRIVEILNSMKTEDNKEQIDNAINKLNSLSDETIEKICAGKSEEQIRQILENRILESKKEETRVDLNDMWYYGRTGSTVHIHLVLKDLHPIKDKLGPEKFNEFVKNKLEDSLSLLQEVFKKDETIEEVFAVSPIFYHKDWQDMFEGVGFEKLEECLPGTDNERFIEMFNKDREKIKKVFATRIKREDFLEKTYRKYSQAREEEECIQSF